MSKRKFKVDEIVIGNDTKAAFRQRMGTVVDWVPKSGEYGVRFYDRANDVEYVCSGWIDRALSMAPDEDKRGETKAG